MKSFVENLKVIDLSTVLAGPSVGMFFAELGAKVTKIEHPVHKDVTRSWKLKNEDKDAPVSAYFSAINYKKEYSNLDLNKSTDVDSLIHLCKSADVILLNFKNGDQEKFGISDETLRKCNPQLIIGKINGYGEESDRVAYDLILQAESGFMSMNGTAESGPVKMPVALIDVLAGHQLKEGILNALLNRTQTNKGAVVSVSLYETAISSLVNQASNYLMNHHIPQRIGSLHPNIAPYGEMFETKDGETITFAIGNNKQFRLLCSFLGLDELTKEEAFNSNTNRIKNRGLLAAKLAEVISQKTAKETTQYCMENNVPAGVVKDLKEVFKEDLAQSLIRAERIEDIDTLRVSSIAFKNKS